MSPDCVRHLLEISDLDIEELDDILARAGTGPPPGLLSGRGVALLFEKPSARTRNAAEVAVAQLGGHPVTIRGDEVGIASGRESPADLARVLAGYHAIVGARVFSHAVLDEMADSIDREGMWSPVLNLLSDRAHPTQAVADLLTLQQVFGTSRGRRLGYIGDANNVCASLAYGCVMSGMTVVVASPRQYRLDDPTREKIENAGEKAGRGGRLVVTEDPVQAASDADALYTDVWVSMGQEEERDERLRVFSGYTVDAALLAHASSGAVVLHCLPAHRGEEITAEVIDGPASVVWRQSENRLHAMRGILWWLHEQSLRMGKGAAS